MLFHSNIPPTETGDFFSECSMNFLNDKCILNDLLMIMSYQMIYIYFNDCAVRLILKMSTDNEKSSLGR